MVECYFNSCKVQDDLLKYLAQPKEERNSVLLEGGCHPKVASSACELTCRLPGLMTRPGKSMQFVKNSQLFNLSVTKLCSILSGLVVRGRFLCLET